VKVESPLLVQSTPQLVQPGPPAVADPVRGRGGVGRAISLVRGHALDQRTGKVPDPAQGAASAQRLLLRPFLFVRRWTPRALGGAEEILGQPVGQQAARPVLDGQVLLKEVGIVDIRSTRFFGKNLVDMGLQASAAALSLALSASSTWSAVSSRYQRDPPSQGGVITSSATLRSSSSRDELVVQAVSGGAGVSVEGLAQDAPRLFAKAGS
jgi:hypothetical protein